MSERRQLTAVMPLTDGTFTISRPEGMDEASVEVAEALMEIVRRQMRRDLEKSRHDEDARRASEEQR